MAPVNPIPAIDTYPPGIALNITGRTDDTAWYLLDCNRWIDANAVQNPPSDDELPIINTDPQLELVVLINDGYEEIVGIRNAGNTNVPIGGWFLNGSYGGDTCTIPDNTWLPAGRTYQIATGRSTPGR